MVDRTVKTVIFPLDGPGFSQREDCMQLDKIEGPGGSKPVYATRELLSLQNVHEKKRQFIHPPKEGISYQKTYYPNPVLLEDVSQLGFYSCHN